MPYHQIFVLINLCNTGQPQWLISLTFYSIFSVLLGAFTAAALALILVCGWGGECAPPQLTLSA
jgi:hypothetical protein